MQPPHLGPAAGRPAVTAAAAATLVLMILTLEPKCASLVQTASTTTGTTIPDSNQQQPGVQPAPSVRHNAQISEQEAPASSAARQSELQRDSESPAAESSALSYLQRYGYMSAPANGAETNNLISEESFSSAVLDFQRFAGLAPTGLVDRETLELMRLPRCGNSDKWQQPGQATMMNLAESSVPLARLVAHAPVNKTGHLNQTRARLASLRRRRKRYALQGSKWRRQELTYRISQYPIRFAGKRHEVDAQIAKAFGIWSAVAPIDFVVKREGRVHIDVRFASGDHGDGDAFDGPGNTLAHAYFPQYGGDAHFDDQEFWTIDSYAGTNIFQVAAHELGHSLGLGHSSVREALMAPFYQKYKPNFRLHTDDVLAIQALYGEKPITPLDLEPSATSNAPSSTTTAPPPPPPPSTTETQPPAAGPAVPNSQRPRFPIYRGLKPFLPGFDALPPPPGRRRPPIDEASKPGIGEPGHDEPAAATPDLSTNGLGGGGGGEETHAPGAPPSYPADLCADSSIDAATRTEDGSSYVFKGDHYWLLTAEGLARGYPRRTSADWDGLPGKLDAALTWADGKTFFFKGNKYWRFRNKRRDVGYPKLISAGFAGIPDDIDAAFVWSGNGRTYIFKGAEYWRFDSKAEPPVSAEYPRPIKVWAGVPAHVDAALKWENNVTYFFKGSQYYRFNDRDFKVETRGRPAFPRQTAEWWFGCANANLAQRALSGSLRESRTMSRTMSDESAPGRPVATSSDLTTASASASEWSLLAGLEENTRLMGTHISDHKPPSASDSSLDNEIRGVGGGGGKPKVEAADTTLSLEGERPGSLADNAASTRFLSAPATHELQEPLAPAGRWDPFAGPPLQTESPNFKPGGAGVRNMHASRRSPPASSATSSSAIPLNITIKLLQILIMGWLLIS